MTSAARGERLITSIETETRGAHAHVRVWVRGALAGELVVREGEEAARLRWLLMEAEGTVDKLIALGTDAKDALEEGARELRKASARELARPAEPSWLVKDFNVLYRIALTFVQSARGVPMEEEPLKRLDDLLAQLARLKPAFDITETERAAGRRSFIERLADEGATPVPSLEDLAERYERTKKAGEGD